jgi:hypothetical protein
MVAIAPIKFPQSPVVDLTTGRLAREWQQWFLNPQFLTITLSGVIDIASGGTGLGTAPGNGQILIGNGTGYTLSTLTEGTSISITEGPGSIQISVTTIDAALITSGTLAAARLPAFSGDVSTPGGSTVTTLATVNGVPGAFGSASNVAAFTVNGKGLVTVAGNVPIAITNAQVSGLGTMSTQSATAVAITGGTLSAVGITLSTIDSTPIGATTPSTGVFVGVSTNSNAAAGIVGEYIESYIALGSATALTTNVAKNVTSISLTAGDWDVSGWVGFTLNGATTSTAFAAGTSSTSATLGTDYFVETFTSAVAGSVQQFTAPIIRFSLAATTTIYLIAYCTFLISTASAYGRISARRIR